MTQGGSNPWSTGPNTPAVRRRWQQARRRARVRSSGVQMDGGERLRGAGAHPRPFQQAAAARAAGDDGPELGSGGRSSGVLGFGVTRHSEISCGALRVPGVTRSTPVQQTQVQELGGAGLAGHGGRRATAMAAQLARGRTREGEVRVNTPGLTARSKSSSVVSGRRRRRRIDRGDRRTDAAMKAAGTTLRCTRRHVGW